MLKRFFLVLGGLAAVMLALFFSYGIFMAHEPVPRKHDVEELVRASDLKKFGVAESSFLETPDNFAYYNKHRIYVVEQGLGHHEQYVDRYAVIAKGEKLTSEEKKQAGRYEEEAASDKNLEPVRILSKHQVTVYEKGEVIETTWLFKAVSGTEAEMRLSFISLETDENRLINLFAEGYEQFADF